MSKYTQGNYIVATFDDLGTKLTSKSLENSGHVIAKAFGEACVKAGECDSFVLLRVVYNSKTPLIYNYDIRK